MLGGKKGYNSVERIIILSTHIATSQTTRHVDFSITLLRVASSNPDPEVLS